MAKKKRSWLRLLFVSLLAGAGVAALRSRQGPTNVPPAATPVPAAPEPAPAPPIEFVPPELVVEPQLVPDAAAERSGAQVAPDAAPQLAFVPETPAQAYVPPAELLPGFGGVDQPADPWTPTETMAVQTAPPELIDTVKTSRFSEWANRTPKRDRIYTYVGAVCVLAAIIATIVVLSL